jgi:hypothetical protein
MNENKMAICRLNQCQLLVIIAACSRELVVWVQAPCFQQYKQFSTMALHWASIG